jgi:hypothetical protein
MCSTVGAGVASASPWVPCVHTLSRCLVACVAGARVAVDAIHIFCALKLQTCSVDTCLGVGIAVWGVCTSRLHIAGIVSAPIVVIAVNPDIDTSTVDTPIGGAHVVVITVDRVLHAGAGFGVAHAWSAWIRRRAGHGDVDTTARRIARIGGAPIPIVTSDGSAHTSDDRIA